MAVLRLGVNGYMLAGAHLAALKRP